MESSGNMKVLEKFSDFASRITSCFFLFFVAVCLFSIHFGNLFFTVVCIVTGIAFFAEIFLSRITGNITVRIYGFLIAICGLMAFVFIRFFYGSPDCFSLILLCSLCDMGSYFWGKLIGGAKLCERISPSKTWAGVIGGFLTSYFGFLVVTHFVRCEFMVFSNFGTGIIITNILFAIIGDLSESYFKRIIGVKDMSNILSGHGGVLDRVDSLIFASIAFFAYKICLGGM